MPLAALWLLVTTVLAFARDGRVAARGAGLGRGPSAPATAASIAHAPAPRRTTAVDVRARRPTASARPGRGADETVQAGHASVVLVVARTAHPPHLGTTPFAPAAVPGGMAPRASDARAPAGATAAAHVVAARGALLPYYPTAPPLQS